MEEDKKSPFSDIENSKSLKLLNLAKVIKNRVILITGVKGSKTHKAIYLLWQADKLAWLLGKLLVGNMTDEEIRKKIVALIKTHDWENAVDEFFGSVPSIGVYENRPTIDPDNIEINERLLCQTGKGEESTSPVQAILLVD